MFSIRSLNISRGAAFYFSSKIFFHWCWNLMILMCRRPSFNYDHCFRCFKPFWTFPSKPKWTTNRFFSERPQSPASCVLLNSEWKVKIHFTVSELLLLSAPLFFPLNYTCATSQRELSVESWVCDHTCPPGDDSALWFHLFFWLPAKEGQNLASIKFCLI